MDNDLGLKLAFCVSLLGHFLFFGINSRNPPVSKDKVIPEEISLNLEIDPPALLPRIETLADEKMFQDQTWPEENSDRAIPEVLPEELSGREQKKEISPSASSMPTHSVSQAAKEKALRYQDMVKQRIEERRIYPAWASRQAIEGEVVVGFIVSASGEAREIRLIRSSGSSLLDQETINTIKRASPFPPIPQGLGADFIAMDVSLIFTLG